MQEIQVRTYEPSSALTVVLAVAVDTTAHSWEGFSPIHLERIITAAASVASYVSERQYSLGLFSNGTPVLADRPLKIAPSRSPDQLTIVLEALASIRPLPIGSMASQLGGQWRRFPMGATVAVVLSLMSEEMPQVLGDMRAQGYKPVVVYVGDDACPEMPEGVMLYEIGDVLDGLEFSERRYSRRVETLNRDSAGRSAQ